MSSSFLSKFSSRPSKTKVEASSKTNAGASSKADGEASSKEFRQSWSETIAKLEQQTPLIDKCFDQVNDTLRKIDAHSIWSKLELSSPNFETEWGGLWSRYRKLLWDSRDTATRIHTYLNDISEIIFPALKNALEEPTNEVVVNGVLEELGKFNPNSASQIDAAEIGDNAHSHRDSFTDLCREVEKFLGRFEASFEETGLQQILKTEMEKAKSDIRQLRMETVKFNIIVAAFGIVLAGLVGAFVAMACLGVSGGMGIGALATILLAAMGHDDLIPHMTGSVFSLKSNGNKRTLKKKQELFKQLKTKMDEAGEMKHALSGAEMNEVFENITKGLGTFGELWGQVSHQLTAVQTQFRIARDSRSTTMFVSRISTLTRNYQSLMEGLHEYATVVDNSGIPTNK